MSNGYFKRAAVSLRETGPTEGSYFGSKDFLFPTLLGEPR
jgi:hypothetical protein